MELSVLSCFLIAVWYWVINCDLGNLGRALMNLLKRCTVRACFWGCGYGYDYRRDY